MTNSSKPFKKSLFVFRRDLRLADNKGLNLALEKSGQVFCVFIVDPAFERYDKNKAKIFLLSALVNLDKQLRDKGGELHVLFGRPSVALTQLIKSHSIDAVFFNKEYTRLGLHRDVRIKRAIEPLCQVYPCDEHLLFPPGMILKKDGKPYTIFTPFYKKARQYSVENTQILSQGVFSVLEKFASFPLGKILDQWGVDQEQLPCINAAKYREKVFKKTEDLQQYEELRNYPAIEGTSMMSALLKFGIVSVREAWWHIYHLHGGDHPLLRQLYWRDFFYHIAFHFPHSDKEAFKPSYQFIQWSNDEVKFKAWCDGKTGFPIVDAGMRELNETGFMHNRVRMIVASFLVKDLHVDWRWGEKYFADKLIDYDPAANNGNWQWAASTGCDAQPYFRIFNPWLQQQKFDKNCEYIKKWVPELADCELKAIHHWYRSGAVDLFNKQSFSQGYPRPIVDHKTQVALVKAMYKESFMTYQAVTSA